jgi:hypothetical protein
MAIQTVMDVIHEATVRAFAKKGQDIDKFSKNITTFNSIATKAMVIYDDCELERTFILVGLHATVDKSWKVTYFKNSAEIAGAGHYDGLMAMGDADNWLSQ